MLLLLLLSVSTFFVSVSSFSVSVSFVSVSVSFSAVSVLFVSASVSFSAVSVSCFPFLFVFVLCCHESLCLSVYFCFIFALSYTIPLPSHCCISLFLSPCLLSVFYLFTSAVICSNAAFRV